MSLQRVKYPFTTVFNEVMNPFFVYEGGQERKKRMSNALQKHKLLVFTV